jgi:hypothetical protein
MAFFRSDARTNLSFQLRVEELEARAVPAVGLTIVPLSDPVEGGAAGVFRVTRDGPTTASQPVLLTPSGSGTVGTDYGGYQAGQQSVVIPAGSAYLDLSVPALADTVVEGNETVTFTVVPDGSGPSTGLGNEGGPVTPVSATVSILDDPETAQNLIHTETFTLEGSSGSVNVALTVTYNATGVTDLYTWSYVVSNPSPNANSWTGFRVPVEDLGADVGNLQSTLGWTASAGSGAVSWSGGTPLAPSTSATFSFTTAPRGIGPATVEVTGNGQAKADLPTAPAPRQISPVTPRASMTFSSGTHTYTFKMDMTASDGTAYTIPLQTINQNGPKDARDEIFAALDSAGWSVKKAGDQGLLIFGINKPGGTVAAIASGKMTIRGTSVGTATLTAASGVTVVSDVGP